MAVVIVMIKKLSFQFLIGFLILSTILLAVGVYNWEQIKDVSNNKRIHQHMKAFLSLQ